MLLRVVVGANQRPVKADVLKDQTGLPALGPCLQSKMQKWDLGSLQAAAGDQVVFPLVFKPEELRKGDKRVLVPMSAQETQGPQRFVIDDGTIGEAPLASVSMLTVPPKSMSPGKSRKDDDEEVALYVLDGGFKVGAAALAAGDVLWLGAHSDRPAITPTGPEAAHAARDPRARRGHGAEGHPRRRRSRATRSRAARPRRACCSTAPAPSWPSTRSTPRPAPPSRRTSIRRKTRSSTSSPVAPRPPSASTRTRPRPAMRCASPANTAHSMKVTEALRAIQIYAPGGPEQRFKKEK